MPDLKPTITTAKDIVSFVHNLRTRLQHRNQDFRTISHAKALHAVSEAKGYASWQHYSAELLKAECIELLTNKYDLHPANAEAAWNTLTNDEIRYTNSAEDLAEKLTYTYASVPLPAKSHTSKEAQLNQAMLEDCLDVYERLNNGENVEDIGVYGAKVSGVEICLTLGSSSNLYLLVDNDRCVQKGRIETSGWSKKDTLELNADQLMKIGDLFHIEIESELAKAIKD